VSGTLIEAVRSGTAEQVRRALDGGARPDQREAASGLTALMIAAGRGDAAMVRALLDAGADVHTTDAAAGATALHKACQGGDLDVVRALLEAGSFVDAVAPTTGHTPLMDALWFKWPDLVGHLLDQGAGLNLSTHYGFTLKEHFAYELQVNTFGKERLLDSEKLLRRRQEHDDQLVESQALMRAVVADDATAVLDLLGRGAEVDERAPRTNGFNDGHTPLHVATREGRLRVTDALLTAGADVNAVEPVFGAVPLHKAVYNGHVEITRLLVARPGVDLDFQGATNGYAPLHDALWHGYADCARVLVLAGAAVHLVGHDGKTPLDLANDVLGPAHEVTGLIDDRTREGT
jgi:uncharacterized protein